MEEVMGSAAIPMGTLPSGISVSASWRAVIALRMGTAASQMERFASQMAPIPSWIATVAIQMATLVS